MKEMALLLLLSLFCCVPASAQGNDDATLANSNSLMRGQKRLSVEFLEQGKRSDEARAEVETLLRGHGITLLPRGSYPVLHVAVDYLSNTYSCGMASGVYYGMSGHISFEQVITAGGAKVPVFTFWDGQVGVAGGLALSGQLQAMLHVLVKGFLETYDEANGGGSPSSSVSAGEDNSAATRSLPLYEKKVNVVYRGVLGSFYSKNFSEDQAVRDLADLVRKGQKVITCIYGPADPGGTGFNSYDFWYEHMPDGLDKLFSDVPDHPFSALPLVAVHACPATSAAARQLAHKNQF